jgi:hypothetical protein
MISVSSRITGIGAAQTVKQIEALLPWNIKSGERKNI